MAPEALARRVTAGLLAFSCFAIACSRATDVKATWKIEPSPPVSETVTVVRLTLQHDDGRPVQGAKLQLEAHMAHPGMAPVTSHLIERSSGAYEARLQLSMPGDWVFVVTGELADGSRLTREIQVPAVRPGG
jgi:hypothetical protein